MTTRRTAAAVLAAVACCALAACDGPTSASQPALRPVSVALQAATTTRSGSAASASSSAPAPITAVNLGLIYSAQSPAAQGRDWLAPSAGALVAKFRWGLGGVEVTFTAIDDGGTSAQAQAAARTLVQQHVAGVVVASTGSHLGPALATLSGAGLPTLLPYDASAVDLPDVWNTGPVPTQVGRAVASALSSAGASRPAVITADGTDVDGLAGARRYPYTAAGLTALLTRLDREIAARSIDSVVVSGSAGTEATVTAALQARTFTVPIVLGPTAVSPVFASQLVAAGGTTSGQFTTVGTDTGDALGLSGGSRGAAAAAFFAAVRLAAADGQLTDLLGGPFSDVAGYADIPSHDAVTALVDAVETARSTDPARVSAVLRGSTPATSSGIVGPELDFARANALADSDVIALHATNQSPGVRAAPEGTDPAGGPASAAPVLYWFGESASK